LAGRADAASHHRCSGAVDDEGARGRRARALKRHSTFSAERRHIRDVADPHSFLGRAYRFVLVRDPAFGVVVTILGVPAMTIADFATEALASKSSPAETALLGTTIRGRWTGRPQAETPSVRISIAQTARPKRSRVCSARLIQGLNLRRLVLHLADLRTHRIAANGERQTERPGSRHLVSKSRQPLAASLCIITTRRMSLVPIQVVRSHCQRGRLRKYGACGACPRTVASQRTTTQESDAPKSANRPSPSAPPAVTGKEAPPVLSQLRGSGHPTKESSPDRVLAPYSGSVYLTR
jgi:hypothetical protein